VPREEIWAEVRPETAALDKAAISREEKKKSSSVERPATPEELRPAI